MALNRALAPGRRRSAGSLFAILIALAVAAPAPAIGPAVPPAEPADTAAPPAQTLPPPERLERHIEELTANKELEEPVRTKSVELCRQVQEQLRIAEEWSKRQAAFEKSREEAPGLLTKLNQDLTKKPEEPKIELPSDASVAQLEIQLAQSEAELEAAQKLVNELDAEPRRRADRRQEIPQAVAAVRKRLEELATSPAASPPTVEHPEIVGARQWLQIARRKVLEAELKSHEAEMMSYEARSELLTARRELAVRQKTRLEKIALLWRSTVNRFRRIEAEKAAAQARAATEKAGAVHPELEKLAERNRELAELRTGPEGLAARIEEVTRRSGHMDKAMQKLDEDFKNLKKRLAAAGLTEALALLMRRQRTELQRLAPSWRAHRMRQKDIAGVQLQLIELEDERHDLADSGERVDAIVETLPPEAASEESEQIATLARRSLQKRDELLDSLIHDHNSYFRDLVDLDAQERALAREAAEFSAFIDEHILWIRSTPFASPGDFPRALQALRWLVDLSGWDETGGAGLTEVTTNPITPIAVIFFLITIFVARRQLRSRMTDLGDAVRRSYNEPFQTTLWALGLTLLISVPWPAVFGSAAWLFGSLQDAPEHARAIAAGAITVAVAFQILEFLRQVCRPAGLGDAHFRWKPETLQSLRTNLLSLMIVGLPALLIVAMMETQSSEHHQASLGRIAFIVMLGAASFFSYRLLDPSTCVFEDLTGQHPTSWLVRCGPWMRAIAVTGPILLAVLAAAGYYYTSIQLAIRLFGSVTLLAAIVIANAVLTRWLFIARARLAIEQTRRRREAAEEAEAETGELPTSVPAEPEIDLAKVNVQTRKLLRASFGLVVILGLVWVWSDVLPAFGIFKKVQLWSYTVQASEEVAAADGTVRVERLEKQAAVTLADLLVALLLIAATVIASRNAPGMLEITLFQWLAFEAGGRYALTTLTQYMLTIVGALAVFNLFGVGWTQVQWLAAAMSVGLGFGLQEIFANFVSGIVLLFERPIRVGDTVTVGDVSGTVTEIRIRATTIRDWNRKELIVPNKEFITGRVINWTLTDNLLRIVIPIGIAYGSDTRKARSLMLKIANDHRKVLEDPEPSAWFQAFGESSLDFSLRCFVASLDDLLEVQHDIHQGIDDAFRKAGIEIAFPQRDIHLHASDSPLQVVLSREKKQV